MRNLAAAADSGSESVGRYYSECWVSRFESGHNPRSLAMHFGLAGSEHEGASIDCEAAKLATNTIVHGALARLQDRPARIADMGCGVGGTLVDLASREASWRLVGVNIGKDQLAFASKALASRGLSSKVDLVCAGYDAVPVPDATFDAVYFIESACHAVDRPLLVREIRRVVRPGGELVVVDFFRTAEPLVRTSDQDAYRRVCRGFCIPDYFDTRLEDVLVRAGMVHERTIDLSGAVVSAVERSAARAGRTLPRSVRWAHHFETLGGLAHLLETGHLRYGCVVARK